MLTCILNLNPLKKILIREIIDEDLQKLTQIPMIRITRFDSDKADENIAKLEEEIEQVKHHLAHLIEYAIDYFTRLKEKYGKGRERLTELRNFDNIQATKVVLKIKKFYVK